MKEKVSAALRTMISQIIECTTFIVG